MSAGAGHEIERVWTLRAMPVMPVVPEIWEIEQGYLAPLAETEDALAALGFPEGRLRRIVEPSGRARYLHTVKSGSGIVRTETEREITREEFEQSWPRTRGRRLSKTRHRVRVGTGDGARIWEIDRFHDLPLVMAEVELPDENAPCAMPEWIAELVEREVSLDARYRNAALAMHGLPRDA